MRIAASPCPCAAAGGHRDESAAQQFGVDLQLLVAGVEAGLVGATHIWTKRTGSWCSGAPVSRQESFFSECRMPRPALIRWARPG